MTKQEPHRYVRETGGGIGFCEVCASDDEADGNHLSPTGEVVARPTPTPTKQEHCVNVANGKYTLVVVGDRPAVRVIDRSEGDSCVYWVDNSGSAAVRTAIMELDAARVVVQAARDMVEEVRARRARGEEFDPQYFPLAVSDALALHDRLTSDRDPPSAWYGVTETTVEQPDPVGYISDARLAEIAARASRDVDDVRLMSSVNARDLQLIVAELQRRRGRSQHDATYRALDTAATFAELNALWAQLSVKLCPADRADAERRYYEREAWLEAQASKEQAP